MYLIRRNWRVADPRDTRLAATIVAEIGKDYEASGQRGPTTISFNGGTTPGERGIVSMSWVAERIESPYRGDNTPPEDTRGLRTHLRELTTESWIEFSELMTTDKAVELDW